MTSPDRKPVETIWLGIACNASTRVVLEKLIGPATVMVENGGAEPKLYAYYQLKTPTGTKEERAKVATVREVATKVIGGDLSHMPPEPEHLSAKVCRIISHNANEIDLDAALRVLLKARNGVEPPSPADEPDDPAGSGIDPLTIARGYLARGWNPIPVSRRTKTPIGLEWQKRRLTEETAAKFFNSADMNVGVQSGPMSNGLTDVDLDCREAVAIGPMLLPASNNVFGRASKPRSHWLYNTTLADKIDKAHLQFKDVDGTMMLELKIGGGGKGTQSVFPGSTHEGGEAIEWARDGVLVTVDANELLRQVRRLAVAVLLARHWPVEGARHDAALTVGGFLARAGLDEDAATMVLGAIATAVDDPQWADRVQAARDAVKQYGNGGETRGLPMLVETFGEKVANKTAEWLSYKPQMAADETMGPLPLIVELGSRLWGPAILNGKEYRFGAGRTKKVIDPIKGMWFDFTANKGGNLRDLMKKVEVANRKQSSADDVVTVCAADIVMRPLDWIWIGHLLRGSQELMSGLPDLSKSTVQIDYVACATARLPWPDGAPAVEPMNVVMLTAEDTLDQIVMPRLVAAGADVGRVHILKCIRTDECDRQFLLGEDLDRLEHHVKKIGGVGLITIDPLTAYMGGTMDSHRTTEVRSQLGPLKDFAERLNIGLSTITHPAKNAGQRALDHFIGSQAFIAACRVGHLCIAEMEEGEDGKRIPTGRILFANVRNTAYRGLMPTLAYRKQEVTVGTAGQGSELRSITAPKIIWEGAVDITADAAVDAASGKKQSDVQPRVQAFLREMLKDGKVLQKEIEEAAKTKGFTEKQLRTARETLSIQPAKEKGKMDGPWFWQLPDPSEGRYHY